MENKTLTRFWSRVEKTSTCWNWTDWIRQDGYGRFFVDGKTKYAHRVAYELLKGPIPTGLTLDHLCRNRKCVNPDHLEAVTNKANILRGKAPQAKNARKTHCKKGHPLSGDNLYINPKGERNCRTCQDENRKKFLRTNPGYMKNYKKRRQNKGGKPSAPPQILSNPKSEVT
jgi:hypothetical protein